MEGYRRKPRRDDIRREVWESVQRRNRRKDRKKGKAGAKKQGGIGKTLGGIRGVERRNRIGMKTCLHAAQWTSKMLKQRLRVGDLDLPERINRYTSSREEEVDAQMCPCGKVIP